MLYYKRAMSAAERKEIRRCAAAYQIAPPGEVSSGGALLENEDPV